MTVFYLSDLLTLGLTMTSTCGNDEICINGDGLATTLTSTISTATANSGPIMEIHAAAARDYICSLSVEEIDDIISKVDERTVELKNSCNDDSKVKKLGSMNSLKI